MSRIDRKTVQPQKERFQDDVKRRAIEIAQDKYGRSSDRFSRQVMAAIDAICESIWESERGGHS